MTRKKIEELSNEELGRLFPIEISPYDPEWTNWFLEEKELLLTILSEDIILRIEHIGSTAVAGLSAKPTIDILIEIPLLTAHLKDLIIEKMKGIHYNFIWRTDSPIPYMMFTKGYTLEGIKDKSFHVHMVEQGHPLWDTLYFRDNLRQNSDIAKAYEDLKMEFANKFRFDREGYTKAKTDFITAITNIAKKS